MERRLLSLKEENLEVTTQIGCPIYCRKYCPQETLIQNYHSPIKTLSLTTFQNALETVPENVWIVFSGFAEPFANPDCLRMIEYASERGYGVALNTTLYGASKKDVARLLKIPFGAFLLHLPDGDAMRIQVSQEYMENVFAVLQGMDIAVPVLMNHWFRTNHREDIARGVQSRERKVGFCFKHRAPQFVMLPSGDVQICCIDFALENKVGNLLEESYSAIKARYLSHVRGYSLCRKCDWNVSLSHYLLQRVVAFGRARGW
jgi:organic radical activating enzyme